MESWVPLEGALEVGTPSRGADVGGRRCPPRGRPRTGLGDPTPSPLGRIITLLPDTQDLFIYDLNSIILPQKCSREAGILKRALCFSLLCLESAVLRKPPVEG